MTTSSLIPKLLLLAPIMCFGQIKNNCLESKITTYTNGQLVQEILKKYNKSNLLVAETKSVFNSISGNYTEETILDYDKDGNNNSIVLKRNGNVFQEKTNQFSKTKKLIQSSSKINNIITFRSILAADSLSREDIFFEENGTKEGSKEKVSFDISGKIIGKELKNAQGQPLLKQSFSYNNSGKITSENTTDFSNNSTKTTTYSYNSSGKLLSEKTTFNNILFAETKFVYDSNNNLNKTIRLNDKGGEEYSYIYEYNSKGYISKEIYFYGKQQMSSHLYEYDNFGNIIKETILDRTGKVFSEVKREFICL